MRPSIGSTADAAARSFSVWFSACDARPSDLGRCTHLWSDYRWRRTDANQRTSAERAWTWFYRDLESAV